MLIRSLQAIVLVILPTWASETSGVETNDVDTYLNHVQLADPVDLLDKIDPVRDTKHGTHWTKPDGALRSSEDTLTSLRVGEKYPQNYLLRAKVRRRNLDNTLAIVLKVGEQHCHLYVNGWYGKASGIHMLDKKEARDAANPTRSAELIVPEDRNVELVIAVEGNRIAVFMEGHKHIDWEGDSSRLSMHPYARCEADGTVWLATMKCVWEISAFTLTEITGRKSSPTDIVTNPRLPLPDPAAIDRAMKDLAEQHGVNFAERRINEKLPLAKKLIAYADADLDPVHRFVMLDHGSRLAVEGRDVVTAWQALDRLGAEYEIKISGRKAEALRQVARSARTPYEHYANAKLAHDLGRDALAVHEYDDAVAYVTLAGQFARTSRVESLSLQLSDELKRYKVWKDKYDAVRPERLAFEHDEKNAEAALSWGRFLCLDRELWKEGLSVLATGNDTPLVEIAKQELQASQQSSPKMLPVIDAWRRLEKQESDPDVKRAIARHVFSLLQTVYSSVTADQVALVNEWARECLDNATLLDLSNEPRGMLIGGENVNVGKEATIEFWFRSSDGEGWCIMKQEDERQQTIGLHMHYNTAVVYARTAGYYVFQDSKLRMDDGKWHHAAVCKFENHLSLYLDGQLAAQLEIKEGFPAPSNSPWRIGYNPAIPDRKFDAIYARIRISSVARYHVPFTPPLDYSADRATLLMR